MKTPLTPVITSFAIAIVAGLVPASARAQTPNIPNPLIDYSTFLHDALRVKTVRESRRLTEDQFLQAMTAPDVILLDARSAAKFKLLHLRGAVNLSLTDFTAADLARYIPNKDTRILIYCNNNFLGSPVAMASKIAGASLNISTYVTLTTYGYTNVYELGPLIDVKTSTLPFAGDEVSR